ncbi:hypothetical protein BKA64DRAFT_745798 [Cadophora sp. MPI-SDFR-AT-0126]|nr:hypothetical protein BKA64DRAFT_745798 [Leotiomycetes sp. MPI-SDFR-AT-0126]
MTKRPQLAGLLIEKLDYNNQSVSHVSGDLDSGLEGKTSKIPMCNMIFSDSATIMASRTTPEMDSPALFHTKFKKPRTSRPKVRSGCFTCKKRRVKCDENKPQCYRCCKFGRVCPGYKSEKNDSTSPSPRPETRTILPKPSICPPPTLSLSTEISEVMFQATEEFLSFRLFCTQTSREPAGVFQTTTWNRIVLQSSHQYAFLRHAIVTIGSLSMSIKDALNNNDIPPSIGPELWNSQPAFLRTNNDFALRQYNKFLRGSRQALISGPEGQRLALIVCLLIICIETLQWHHLQVLSHIYSGVQLLNSFIASQEPVIQAGLLPYIIEDEIVEQFHKLEVEANMLFEPFPVSHHHILTFKGEDLISSMPETFLTVEEAKYYLDLLTRRTRHLIASFQPVKPSTPDFGRERDTSCIDPELLDLSPGLRSTFDNPSPSPPPITSDPGLSTSLTHLTTLLSAWQRSFTPLFESTTDSTSTTYLPTLHLAILSEALTITLHTSLSTSSPSTSTHLPSSQRILTLSTTILHHPCFLTFLSQSAPSASSGLIGPLRLILQTSRHRSLRHQAISLLQHRPWREGVWWSCSAGQLCTWLSSIEEDGIPEDEDVIPEGATARLLEVGIWEEGSVTTVKAVCVRGDGEEAEVRVGEWIWTVGGEEGSVVPEVRDGGTSYGCEERVVAGQEPDRS